jgi:invasion protein IalB
VKRKTEITLSLALCCVAFLALPLTWQHTASGRNAAEVVPPSIEGPSSTEQTFGQWVSHCQHQADGKSGPPTCALTQNVVVQNDGKAEPVMSVILTPTQGAQGHTVTMQVPLGIRLKQGLNLTIDQGPPLTQDFDFCGPRGCWASRPVDDTLLSSLKSGTTGRVQIMRVTGQPTTIEFPLAGFGPGLAALDSGNGTAAARKAAVK